MHMRRVWSLVGAMSALLFMGSTSFALADDCTATALTALRARQAGAAGSKLRICGTLPPTAVCVPDGSDTAVQCCAQGTPGIAPGATCPTTPAAGGGAAQWTAPARRSTLQDVRWWVPRGELRDCIENGSCSLEQIMMVIAAFANFLLTVSGSFLLLAFVVGGTFYLTAAGSAERAKKGMKMITDASIGIVIIVLAGTIIRFVYRSLAPSTDDCSTRHPGFVCQFVPGATEQERSRNGVGDRKSTV